MYSEAEESKKNEILETFYNYIKDFIYAHKNSPVILMTLNDLSLTSSVLEEIF